MDIFLLTKNILCRFPFCWPGSVTQILLKPSFEQILGSWMCFNASEVLRCQSDCQESSWEGFYIYIYIFSKLDSFIARIFILAENSRYFWFTEADLGSLPVYNPRLWIISFLSCLLQVFRPSLLVYNRAQGMEKEGSHRGTGKQWLSSPAAELSWVCLTSPKKPTSNTFPAVGNASQGAAPDSNCWGLMWVPCFGHELPIAGVELQTFGIVTTPIKSLSSLF